MRAQTHPERRLSAPEVIEVAAGLLFQGGRLLITQRYPGAHLGGLWELPGGKRHSDESFEQCLSRELKEELGIDIAVLHLFQSILHRYPEKTVRLHFYICSLTAGEPQALGCAAFAWVQRPALKNYVFPAADARLLQRLRRSPALWRSEKL